MVDKVSSSSWPIANSICSGFCNSFATNLLILRTTQKPCFQKGMQSTLYTSWTGYKLCSEKGIRTWSLSQWSFKFCGCGLGGWPHVTLGSWKIKQTSQSQCYNILIIFINSEFLYY
jgi:hypothetical protein